LALSVEERQNEVKEIALAKIAWRLLLKVRSTQAHAANIHAVNYYNFQTVCINSGSAKMVKKHFVETFDIQYTRLVTMFLFTSASIMAKLSSYVTRALFTTLFVNNAP